jgi:hypothetical protein
VNCKTAEGVYKQAAILHVCQQQSTYYSRWGAIKKYAERNLMHLPI